MQVGGRGEGGGLRGGIAAADGSGEYETFCDTFDVSTCDVCRVAGGMMKEKEEEEQEGKRNRGLLRRRVQCLGECVAAGAWRLMSIAIQGGAAAENKLAN